MVCASSLLRTEAQDLFLHVPFQFACSIWRYATFGNLLFQRCPRPRLLSVGTCRHAFSQRCCLPLPTFVIFSTLPTSLTVSVDFLRSALESSPSTSHDPEVQRLAFICVSISVDVIEEVGGVVVSKRSKFYGFRHGLRLPAITGGLRGHNC